MFTELAITIILLLLVLSFYFHYGTNINIKTLFAEKEEIKKQIQELKKFLKKYD